MMSALEGAIAKRSAFMIVLSRLSPVFPFAVLGYVLGATKVKATTFTWAFVGLIPGVTLYTFIGMSAAAAASGTSDSSSLSNYISIGAGVLATLVISWQAKKIIEEATASVKRTRIRTNCFIVCRHEWIMHAEKFKNLSMFFLVEISFHHGPTSHSSQKDKTIA